MKKSEMIGELFDCDGSNLALKINGKEFGIGDICKMLGAKKIVTNNSVVYEFDDESAIVIASEAWDYRPASCKNACWETSGCTCSE